MPKKLAAVTTCVSEYTAAPIGGVVKALSLAKLKSTALYFKTSPDISVCTVPFEALSDFFVGLHELKRDERGNLKYVQRIGDGSTYSSSYFNSEMGKIVLLGNFSDPHTAAFAHALARADRKSRMIAYHAQDRIEREYANSFANPQIDESTLSSEEFLKLLEETA